MHYLIAGGTGFIGQALAYFWLAKGHKVTVLGRSLPHIQQTFGQRVTAVSWQNLAEQGTVLLQDKQAVVNLAGANIGSARWSAKRKAELLSSRITPTQLLASYCAQLGSRSPFLLNASGCGIYGLQSTVGHAFTDTVPLVPINPGFLASLAQRWEHALTPAVEADVKVFALRFGVVLAKQGGVLAKLLLAYRLGLGGQLGKGHQPFAWISLPDLCRAVDFICNNYLPSGAINVVAPQALSQIEFAKLLAGALHRPCKMIYPGWLLRSLLGQMGEELLLQGQHTVPTKLLQLGFTFQFPLAALFFSSEF